MTNIDTMKPIIASAISNPAGTCGNGCADRDEDQSTEAGGGK